MKFRSLIAAGVTAIAVAAISAPSALAVPQVVVGTTATTLSLSVPTRIYFKDGRAKVEIALGRGKDSFDKRQSIKAREQRRDVERALRDVQR